MRNRHLIAVLLSVSLGMPTIPAVGAETVDAQCKAIAARATLAKRPAGDNSPCDPYSLNYGSAGRGGSAADPKAALACALTGC